MTQEAAKQYADEENALFFETSAKSGEGVNEMFEAIGPYCLSSDRCDLTILSYGQHGNWRR